LSWRIAESLIQLRNEVNARWPNRDKASDGFIGDATHAATASDHNPNADGVVCAFDITHDPDNGPDEAILFEWFRTHPQVDLKYIIANRKVASRKRDWVIRDYKGDPHTNHIHVSVGVGPDGKSAAGTYDDKDSWHIADIGGNPPPKTWEEDVTFIAEFLDASEVGKKYLVSPWCPGGPQPGRYGFKVHINNPGELDILLAAGIQDRGKIPGAGFFRTVA
jgi:hypothetical protein